MGMSREFTGIWIPKNIWFTKELNMQEKIFMVEIESLDAEINGNRHCFATNKYFSEFFGLSKNRCSSIIKKLEEKGYINISYKYEGKEIKERYIEVSQIWNTLSQKQIRGIPKTDRGYSENSEEYNTNNDNTNNNTMGQTKKTRKSFIKPTVEEIQEYCNERNNGIDAQYFLDYYESKGWMIGKNKMKSWKACVRTWEHNKFNSKPNSSSPKNDKFYMSDEEKALYERSL